MVINQAIEVASMYVCYEYDFDLESQPDKRN